MLDIKIGRASNYVNYVDRSERIRSGERQQGQTRTSIAST